MSDGRRFRLATYILVGIAPATAIALLPRILLGVPHHGEATAPLRIVVATLSAAGAAAWITGFTVLAFRRMDEYLQAGAKFAWYWGGAFGLAASLPLYVFIGLGGLHWLFPANFHLGADLFRAFVIGYALPITLQVAGVLIAGGVWRLSNR